MGFFEFVLVWVVIATAAGILRDLSKNRRPQMGREVSEELRALREEIRQLKIQNNDVILSLDGSIRQLDRRLDHLENGAHRRTPAAQESPISLSGRH